MFPRERFIDSFGEPAVPLHTGRRLIPEYFCLIPEYVVLKEE